MSRCPRCLVSLKGIEYDGLEMEVCRHCAGLWVGPAELKALVEADELLPAGQPGEGEAPAAVESPPSLLCPSCGRELEEFNYAADTGILLDRCHACDRVWLDGGRLEQVRRAVQDSLKGLEQDLKRFSGPLHEVEVQEDALEQQDNRTNTAPELTRLTHAAREAASRLTGD